MGCWLTVGNAFGKDALSHVYDLFVGGRFVTDGWLLLLLMFGGHCEGGRAVRRQIWRFVLFIVHVGVDLAAR